MLLPSANQLLGFIAISEIKSLDEDYYTKGATKDYMHSQIWPGNIFISAEYRYVALNVIGNSVI